MNLHLQLGFMNKNSVAFGTTPRRGLGAHKDMEHCGGSAVCRTNTPQKCQKLTTTNGEGCIASAQNMYCVFAFRISHLPYAVEYRKLRPRPNDYRGASGSSHSAQSWLDYTELTSKPPTTQNPACTGQNLKKKKEKKKKKKKKER